MRSLPPQVIICYVFYMPKPKILAFAGSLRRGSFNKKLIKIAMEGATQAGADVTLIDLADYPMPLYDGDIEEAEGLPENAKKLKEIFRAHDGLLLSCPEYNSGITGVLKNAIDWVSRPATDKKPLECFDGKVAALVSASTGTYGGMRGLVVVRYILGNIKVALLPDTFSLASAADAFETDDTLKDGKQTERAKAVGAALANMLKR
jgi:chromate reductase